MTPGLSLLIKDSYHFFQKQFQPDALPFIQSQLNACDPWVRLPIKSLCMIYATRLISYKTCKKLGFPFSELIQFSEQMTLFYNGQTT